MKKTVCLAAGIVLVAVALFGTLAPNAASTLRPGVSDQMSVAGTDGVSVIKVAHRKVSKAQRRKFRTRSYRRHHRKFHKRYRPGKRHYRKAHKRFHRHYRRRHTGPKIHVDIYTGYYDPYHYSPHHYDPYYYGPPYRTRLSCKRVRRIVARHGYHRLRAYDCRGKVYGFTGYFYGKRYKIRVSAYSGLILSRRRY